MSRRSASPAEDAIHDLFQTMSQKERDARYDAKHKQLCVSVSRALENAAWTLDEFCNNDADRQTVWTEISDGAQRMLVQLVAAGRPRARATRRSPRARRARSPSRRRRRRTATPAARRRCRRTTAPRPPPADAPRPSTGPHGTLRKGGAAAPRPASRQLEEDPIEDSDASQSPRAPPPEPSQQSVIEIDDDAAAPPAEDEHEWSDDDGAGGAASRGRRRGGRAGGRHRGAAAVPPAADGPPAAEDEVMVAVADDDEEEEAPKFRVGDAAGRDGRIGQVMIVAKTTGWWKIQIPSSDKAQSRRSKELTARADDGAAEDDEEEEEEEAAPPKGAAPRKSRRPRRAGRRTRRRSRRGRPAARRPARR